MGGMTNYIEHQGPSDDAALARTYREPERIAPEHRDKLARAVDMRPPTPNEGDAPPPPFVKIREIGAERCKLDEILSILIGRLAPYCASTIMAAADKVNVVYDGDSSLEQSLDAERVLLAELFERACDLNNALRL